MLLYNAELITGVMFLILVPLFLYLIHRADKKKWKKLPKKKGV